MSPQRPRLALPFTILEAPDSVTLVAGEDYRYTFRASGLEAWLPGLLREMDGRRTSEELLGRCEPAAREVARDVLQRMYGERILVEGSAADAHPGQGFRVTLHGGGPLRESLEAACAELAADAEAPELALLCQDRLDHDEAWGFARRSRERSCATLWVTTGPMTRGFVSGLFLPDAGPCLACLLGQFQRISPTPELYELLAEHARGGGAIAAVPFAAAGLRVLEGLALWKLGLVADPTPAAALYRLHVLEAGSLEVTSHRVLVDPDCAVCGSG